MRDDGVEGLEDFAIRGCRHTIESGGSDEPPRTEGFSLTRNRDDLLDERALLLVVLLLEHNLLLVERLERLGREVHAVRLISQFDVAFLALDSRSFLLGTAGRRLAQ